MSQSHDEIPAESATPRTTSAPGDRASALVRPYTDLSKPAPVWLQRLSLAVLVLFCLYVGGVLAMLPWSPRYWDQNGWLLAHPALEAVLRRGWVRGLITGVGLLDIWIGISELLNYRDFRR